MTTLNFGRSILRSRGLQGLGGAMAVFSALAVLVLTFVAVVVLVSTLRDGAGDAAWPSLFSGFSKRTCPDFPGGFCPGWMRSLSYDARPTTLGSFAALAPIWALIYGLSFACLCFFEIAKGRFLAKRTVGFLKHFAVGGVLFVVATPFSGVIGRSVASFTHWMLHGSATATSYTAFSGFDVRFSGGFNSVLVGIFAVTLTIIAGIMVKASTIADDHAQII